MNEPHVMMTPSEVALRLGVSRQRVAQLDNALQPVLFGCHRKYSSESVERYVAEREAADASRRAARLDANRARRAGKQAAGRIANLIDEIKKTNSRLVAMRDQLSQLLYELHGYIAETSRDSEVTKSLDDAIATLSRHL